MAARADRRAGSGKSTVLRLLARFVDPTGGRILLDGHDISHCTQESLRRQIGIVFQDGLLLDGTIRENIRLGTLEAKESEIEAVAALVGLHDIVERFPHGYDTVVGPSGQRLSGGQRQLVAIARAMLRDPTILLLDEPPRRSTRSRIASSGSPSNTCRGGHRDPCHASSRAGR